MRKTLFKFSGINCQTRDVQSAGLSILPAAGL